VLGLSGIININTICPICENSISFDVESGLFLNSTRFPIQFLIEHCNNSFIAYIDENYEIKGLQPINNILDRHQKQGGLVTSEFIESLSKEEKEVLCCSLDYESVKNQSFPNVLEKQIILQIAKKKEVSIAILMKILAPLEKALNRTIDQKTVLKIIDKYSEKGIINKKVIKFEKEKSNFDELNILQRGDVM